MARRKGPKAFNKASTSTLPPQRQKLRNKKPAKEKPSGNSATPPNSNCRDITKPQETAGVQALSDIRQHPTYTAVLPRHIPLARNLSVTALTTNQMVDSGTTGNSLFTNTSRNMTPVSPRSSDSKIREEISASNSTQEDDPPRYYTVVDTEETLHEFLSAIDKAEDCVVDIFVDAEGGVDHGRNGNLNGITVKMVSQDQRWMLDPRALGDKLFDTSCRTGKMRTFREILEAEHIPVVFFDVRADADSIYHHCKVYLGGVIDLQVMEMVTRGSCPTFRNGLDRCIRDLPGDKLPDGVKKAWADRKSAGKSICSGPEGYAAFDKRPLPRALEEYAINDVELMPELFNFYSLDKGLCEDEDRMRLVMKLSKQAVDDSVSPDYKGNSPANRFGPRELTDMWGGYDPYDDYFDY